MNFTDLLGEHVGQPKFQQVQRSPVEISPFPATALSLGLALSGKCGRKDTHGRLVSYIQRNCFP